MPDGMGGSFQASGFYAASARDLTRWSEPRLILETKTLYDSPCGESLIRSYPSLVDPASTSRISRQRRHGVAHLFGNAGSGLQSAS